MSRRYIVVGAGFFGAVCARELTDAGHKVLVLERRRHIGGNSYTRHDEEARCHEHVYGPHIFHTGSREVWRYITKFAEFNHFVNRPRVVFGDKVYSFPINLLTLHQIYGVTTPEAARRVLERARVPSVGASDSVESWCLANIGRELYEIFVKGYTQKQWNRSPSELPAEIIRRVPVRLTYDDNYYEVPYQGIPIGGYTAVFERLLEGVPLELGVDFLTDRDLWLSRADTVIYTGGLDEFFDYAGGPLDYRSLRFERERVPVRDVQGNAVVNYTSADIPYTRIVEHKHFDLCFDGPSTLIAREFPADWRPGQEAYYPVRSPLGLERLSRYTQMRTQLEGKVEFGGRLGDFAYYDMDQTIAAALVRCRRLLAG